MISVPARWIVTPFLASLKAVVKPPTSKTKRRVIQVKCKYPLELFEDFMKPLQNGDALLLERDEEGHLKPTKDTASSTHYEYKIKRPTVTDKLFSLEKADVEPGPRTKEPGAWRRGSGAARLNLPQTAHKKGRMATSISMVAGSCHVHLIVPKRERNWPSLTLRFLCLTANRRGNISWPANFATESRGLLRKLVKQKLQAMLKDDSYPTHPLMSEAAGSSSAGDTVLALQGPVEPWVKQPRRPLLLGPQ